MEVLDTIRIEVTEPAKRARKQNKKQEQKETEVVAEVVTEKETELDYRPWLPIVPIIANIVTSVESIVISKIFNEQYSEVKPIFEFTQNEIEAIKEPAAHVLAKHVGGIDYYSNELQLCMAMIAIQMEKLRAFNEWRNIRKTSTGKVDSKPSTGISNRQTDSSI